MRNDLFGAGTTWLETYQKLLPQHTAQVVMVVVVAVVVANVVAVVVVAVVIVLMILIMMILMTTVTTSPRFRFFDHESCELIDHLFEWMVDPCLYFVQHNCKFQMSLSAATAPIHMVRQLQTLFSCLFKVRRVGR